MVKLIGTGGNQVPTNNMLGNMAFQNKEGVAIDLLGLAAGTAAAPSLIPTGDPNTGVWFPAADTIAASTGGTERLRVTSTGLVGIGTTTPYNNLQVSGPLNFTAVLKVSDLNTQSTGAIVLGDGLSNAANFGIWRGAANSYTVSGNTLNIQGDGIQFMTGVAAFGSGTERMRIASAGNVGIGTNNPSEKLTVTGGNILLDTGRGLTWGGSENFIYGNHASDFIAIVTDNSERMRINATGNVGIGTTTLTGKFSVNLSNSETPTDAIYSYVNASVYPGSNNTTAGKFLNAGFGTAYGVWGEVIQTGYGVTYGGYFKAGGIYDNSYGVFAEARNPDTGGAGVAYGGYFKTTSGGVAQTGSTMGVRVENTATTGAVAYGLVVSTVVGANSVIPFQALHAGSEIMRLTSTGNLGLGTSSFGTSSTRTLAIGSGTAPTTGPADTLQIYSSDLSAGNTMLSIYTEGTSVNANTTAAATHRIAIRVNGTVYYVLANTSA